MRIPSGVIDQYIYFVAVDATDLKTRETGLSTFTVYRSRNGAAAAAWTTPTINETDVTNMPGVYELLFDEDTTLDAGDQSQEIVVHITHAGMAPVTRVIEIYRPSVTAGETLTVASGVGSANAVQISADSTAADNCELFFDGTGYNAANSTVGTVTTLTGHTAQTGDNFARLGAPAGASVSADIAAVKSDTAAILTDTGTTGVPISTGGIATTSFAAGAIDAAAIAANAIGASELAADAVDEILDETVGDGTITMRQALRVLISGMAGKLSGAATTTVTVRNLADSADVIVATVDADGNRSAVTVTP